MRRLRSTQAGRDGEAGVVLSELVHARVAHADDHIKWLSVARRSVAKRRGAAGTQAAGVPLLGTPELRLSVVVPAYREAERIGATVAALHAGLLDIAASGGCEVIVVDDGSDDRTADAAREGGADQVLKFPCNRGKGAAVRAGVRVARGRTIAFTDADLSYEPAQLRLLLAAIEGGAGMAVGNRYHDCSVTTTSAGTVRNLASRAFSAITSLALLSERLDTQCGLKAFDRNAADVLFSRARIDRFAFDMELFFLARRFGVAIVDIPVHLVHAQTSSVRLQRDAIVIMADVARVRFLARTGQYDRVPADPVRSDHAASN